MDVHSFQRKTIFSRNYRSQGLYLYLKQRRKETDTRTGNDSLIWYSWDTRNILRLSSKGRNWVSVSAAALQVCWLSWSLSMSPAAAVGPFCKCLSAGLPLSMAERLMGSPEARVSQSVLIHCCVQKCQRRKLLSGAAYSKVQLCMIPWWTGLNSRCAEASLTLEFVLSVKHSEKSVSKTVPGIYEWLQLNTVLHLFLAKHFLKDFFAAVSLSDHSFSCTTLKLQSL